MELDGELQLYRIKNIFETSKEKLALGASELLDLTNSGSVNPLVDGSSLASLVQDKPNAEWLLKLVFELSGKNWESVKENGYGEIPNADQFIPLVQEYKGPNGKDYKLPAKFIPEHIAKVFSSMQAEYLKFLSQQQDGKIKARPGLIVQSGFRSHYYQASVFARLVAEKGLDHALKFSMLPGKSQHADFNNMALDINSMGDIDGKEKEFQETTEFTWLLENAEQFGFWFPYHPNSKDVNSNIGLDGVAVEPWHVQFLGVNEAKKLMSQNNIKNLFKEKYKL